MAGATAYGHLVRWHTITRAFGCDDATHDDRGTEGGRHRTGVGAVWLPGCGPPLWTA
jgi:hypothetical protein